MRLSRVPVSSLCRHALVYDPGGLRRSSPISLLRMLRSSTLRLSAVHADRVQASPRRLSLCPSDYERFGPRLNPFSRLDTGPAYLLHPVPDICLLLPAGFATGSVASHYPREELHLLDDINRFHRVCHTRLPTVTDLNSSRQRWGKVSPGFLQGSFWLLS